MMEKTHAFVITIGEPVVIETLARLRKFTPEPLDITVWYDTRGNGLDKELFYKMGDFTDDIITTTKLHGQCEAYGFAFLYLHSPWLLLTYADILVKEGYYEKMRKQYDLVPELASVGQAMFDFEGDSKMDDKNNHPDHIYLLNRAVIDQIGGCCPSFRIYGHTPLEWHYRALERGFHYVVLKDLVHVEKDQHEGRDSLPKEIINRNTLVLEESMKQGFGHNWWTNNLLGD